MSGGTGFVQPGLDAIRARLAQVKSIAVLGLSDSPGRPSHGVALGLQGFGYRIVPVNPRIRHALGLPAYASLDALPAVPDLVDVFRASEHVAGIVDDCIRLGVPALWLQDGVIDAAAARRAQDAGLFVVMDRCLWRDCVQLGVRAPA